MRGDYVQFDPIIRNLSSGSITSSSSQIDWQVYDNGTDATVTLFYGETDHGTTAGNWPEQVGQGVAVVGDWGPWFRFGPIHDLPREDYGNEPEWGLLVRSDYLDNLELIP